jgi:hypothetical protein
MTKLAHALVRKAARCRFNVFHHMSEGLPTEPTAPFTSVGDLQRPNETYSSSGWFNTHITASKAICVHWGGTQGSPVTSLRRT